MKSLEERKKFRKQQKQLIAKGHDPITGAPGKSEPVSPSSGVASQSNSTDQIDDEFSDMTKAQLLQWLGEKGQQMPPKEISLRDDLLAYVRNANAALEANDQPDSGNGGNGDQTNWSGNQ